MCRNIDPVDDALGAFCPSGSVPDVASMQYYHGNQIGTTRFMTDSGGQQVAPAVYTAFGERTSGTMTGPGDRYGYAGAWGYGTHEDFPYLHVGARYYDPATGRFLQRDPIGIRGDLNLYEYVRSEPTALVDSDGLLPIGAGWPRPHPLPRPEPWPVDPITPPSLVPPPFKKFFEWPNWALNCARFYLMWVQTEDFVMWCFVAGTDVHTDHGGTKIEDLVVGDLVASHDPVSGRTGRAHVSAHLSSWTTDLIRITLAGETITCTPEHPFWTANRGWSKAAHLTSEDRLRTLNGEQAPILQVTHENLSEPVRVYNVTVEGLHTYFVGKGGVLVHNKKR